MRGALESEEKVLEVEALMGFSRLASRTERALLAPSPGAGVEAPTAIFDFVLIFLCFLPSDSEPPPL